MMSAFWSWGRRISAISSPCPGPTATATWPPLEILLSLRCGASAATAPGQMSIARGVPTIRVRSGTRSPWGRRSRPAPGGGGGRSRPSRSRRRWRRRRRSRGNRSAPGGHLSRLLEVGVVVDLDPLDAADRGHADAAAAVGELLEAILVVELRVALPGRLERLGELLRGPGVDQRQADVLALGGRRVERLVDAVEQSFLVEVDLHLLL